MSKSPVLLGTVEEQSANVNNNLTELRIQSSSSVESLPDYEGELLRPRIIPRATESC